MGFRRCPKIIHGAFEWDQLQSEAVIRVNEL